MNTEIYRFKVGTFECITVSDGTLTYTPPMFPPPATFLFTNAPKELLDQVLREHNLQPEQWVEWISPYICVVIDTGKHQVLVVLAQTQENFSKTCRPGGLHLETLTRSSSRTDIQTTSAGTPMPRASWLSPTPASSCGKMSGIFGYQIWRS